MCASVIATALPLPSVQPFQPAPCLTLLARATVLCLPLPSQFLSTPDVRRMFAYVTEDRTLGLLITQPTVCPKQFIYFIRTDVASLTIENIGTLVRGCCYRVCRAAPMLEDA